MIRLNDFIEVESLERRSSGVLYINIYSVVDYPRKIKVSSLPYDESFSPGKWRKRIGNEVFYYGESINNHSEEISVDNPLFGVIFRKYLLDLLSENISTPWQLKELRSTLRMVKKITENYDYSDKIRLRYELIIGVRHWQNTNFGLTVDLKINVLDRKSDEHISYLEVGSKYGEIVRKNIWKSVQAFHKHLTPEGKKYATVMRDKFNLITALLKEAFGSSGDEKSFGTPDGEVKITFKPLEIVEVADYGI